MDTPSKQCLLKVLSGPHQGAEVLLRPGTYQVGSAQSCDIIVADALVQPHHFELYFEPPVLTLKASAGNVFVDGKPVKDQATTVPFFTFITVGTTQFIAGPTDANWPSITAADAPPLQLEAAQAETAQATEPGPVNEADAEALVDVIALSNSGGEEGNSSLLTALPTQPAQQPFYLNVGLISAFAAGVLIVSALIYLGTVLIQTPNASNFQVPSLAQRQMAVLEAIDMQGARKEVNLSVSQGQVLVTGFVEKESQRINLRRAILDADTHALVRIQSQESLVESAQAILGELNLPILIKGNSENGVLIATGYIQMPEAWNRAKLYLMRDVEGLVRIDDNVLTAQEVLALATPLLVSSGLAGAINFIGLPQLVSLEGALTQDQVILWETQIKPKLMALIHGRVVIADNLSRANPEDIDQTYFNGEIESLSTGPFGWITLKTGEKYFAGALLPSGYTIVSLDTDGITLRKGTNTVVFKPQRF